MPCADYVDADTPNAYYKGYNCSVDVTNLLVFNLKLEIIHAAVNFPQYFHERKVASLSGLVYPKVGDMCTLPGYSIPGDIASVSRNINVKVIRGREMSESGDILESIALEAADLTIQRVLPGERKSFKWGICALKGNYPILKVLLPANSMKRYRIFAVCACLLNFKHAESRLESNQDHSCWVQRHSAASSCVIVGAVQSAGLTTSTKFNQKSKGNCLLLLHQDENYFLKVIQRVCDCRGRHTKPSFHTDHTFPLISLDWPKMSLNDPHCSP